MGKRTLVGGGLIATVAAVAYNLVFVGAITGASVLFTGCEDTVYVDNTVIDPTGRFLDPSLINTGANEAWMESATSDFSVFYLPEGKADIDENWRAVEGFVFQNGEQDSTFRLIIGSEDVMSGTVSFTAYKAGKWFSQRGEITLKYLATYGGNSFTDLYKVNSANSFTFYTKDIDPEWMDDFGVSGILALVDYDKTFSAFTMNKVKISDEELNIAKFKFAPKAKK